MVEPTVEPGRPEDIEVDEFEPKDIDSSSFADSTSISSSIYQHSYENGRRVSESETVTQLVSIT